MEAADPVVVALKQMSALLTTNPNEPSLYTQLLDYQEKNAQKSGAQKKSTRVETTLLVIRSFEELRRALNIGDLGAVAYEQEIGRKIADGSLNKAEALYVMYVGWRVLKAVLDEQWELLAAKEKLPRKLATSLFLINILNALNEQLNCGLDDLKQPKIATEKDKQKAKLMLLTVRTKLDQKIKACEQELAPHFAAGSVAFPLEFTLAQANSPTVKGLLDYVTTKEAEAEKVGGGRSKVSKRQHICESVLPAFYFARTAADIRRLFEVIAEGIRKSRAEGTNGAESRGAERALVAFRDELLMQVFLLNPQESFKLFTKEQLLAILDEISFSRKVEGGQDTEVAANTMLFIDWIEYVYFKDKPDELNGLRIKHLDRLVLEILTNVNGEEVKVADVLYSKGELWAQTMNKLLEDPKITDESRVLVAVIAYVWNHFMSEKGADHKYLVNIQSVPYQAIADHPRLPKRFKKELDALCRTAAAKTQAGLAAAKRDELSRQSLTTFISDVGVGEDDAAADDAHDNQPQPSGYDYVDDSVPPPVPPVVESSAVVESSEGDVSFEMPSAAMLAASMAKVTRSGNSPREEEVSPSEEKDAQAAVQLGRGSK